MDDELKILQALQRMLHQERREWRMDFAGGSVEALQMLESAAYDVIVTDMRMPVMNGAELLDEVRVRYPDTARMALSGHTDREFIFRAISSTHQFMSKPCDPQVLKQTLCECIAGRGLIEDRSIREFVGKTTAVPSLPETYAHFQDSLVWGDGNITRIGAIVASDIGLSVKCLQLVNSAFFGTPCNVCSPEKAALLIGTDALKETYRQPDVASIFPSEMMQSLNAKRLVEHSLLSSRIARAIAKSEELAPQAQEAIALAGRLHDLGKLMIAGQKAREYDSYPYWSGEERRRMEMQVFGACHCKVGAYLLSLWGFEPDIVEAVAWHHAPSKTTYSGSKALTIVHAANVLALTDEDAPDPESEWDWEHLKTIGAADRLPEWRRLAQAARTTGDS